MTNPMQEIINYLQQVASQWEDITLQWNPTVVRSFDPESIGMLHSRAPVMSKHDHDYIVHIFDRGQVLPRLTDSALRRAVKAATCRHGPILSLTTFAEDVRLLQSCVCESLTSVLTNMSRPQDDTLRKRVHRILGMEFDILYRSHELPITNTMQREEFIGRCYQHIFLHVLRAAPAKGSISRTHIAKLAQQEFHRRYGTCNLINEEGDILIEAPPGAIPSAHGSDDIEVSRRHGNTLFRSVSATRLMYSDHIRDHRLIRSPVTVTFMANHIARIFLFGSVTSLGARSASPVSPAVSLSVIRALPGSLPIHHDESASLFTADDGDSVWADSSYAVSESHLDTASVQWRRPYIRTAIAHSEAASLISCVTSPVNVTPRAQSIEKKPWSISTIDAAQNRSSLCSTTPAKRPRSPERSLGPRSPGWNSQVPRRGYLDSPTFQTGVSEADHWHWRLPQARLSELTRSPEITDTDSPSIYTHERRSSTLHAITPTYGRGAGPLETYTGLQWCGNPFSSDAPAAEQAPRADSIEGYNSTPLHGHVSPLSQSQIGELSIDPFMDMEVTPRATVDVTLSSQPDGGNPQGPRSQSILYKSSLNGNMFFRAPSDALSTQRFMHSQKTIDPRSAFWYMLNGKGKKYATTHYHLHHAIEKYRLTTVFVDSKHLGSTQHPVAYQQSKPISSNISFAAYA